MIAAIGATLHNERKLLERIEHLMVNYRNLGAHPNEFPEEVLRKLRRIDLLDLASSSVAVKISFCPSACFKFTELTCTL